MFSELKVKIPEALKEETPAIEREIEELVAREEKAKLLSEFVEEAMKGAGQLGTGELVKLGRLAKKGRFRELQRKGLV